MLWPTDATDAGTVKAAGALATSLDGGVLRERV